MSGWQVIDWFDWLKGVGERQGIEGIKDGIRSMVKYAESGAIPEQREGAEKALAEIGEWILGRGKS